MDGYIRVSRRMGREGPGYISPHVQREAIQRWADYRGVSIAAWHEDEDASGGSQDRPGLRAAMARVEAGATEGIACWRLNRFARNVSEALEDVKTIHAHDAHLAFIEEDIDPTGPFGRFILTILLAVAALELDNTKAGWRIAKARAIERGAKIGPTPYGYRRHEDGTLQIHEPEADMLRAAFELASRDGVHAAISYLHGNAAGRVWTRYTVERVLANRTYLGEIRYGELVQTFDELALVTRAVWESAQPAAGPRRRKPKASFPLSGLASCAACGSPMVGSRGGLDARRMYRCRASQTSAKGPRCPEPVSTSAERLEQYVIDELRAAWRHEGFAVGGEDSPALDEAEATLREAEAELDAFVSDATSAAALRRLGRYDTALQARVEAVDSAQAAFHDQAADVPSAVTVLPDEVWGTLTAEELRIVLRGALSTVCVRRGRGPLDERVVVVPKGVDAAAWVARA